MPTQVTPDSAQQPALREVNIAVLGDSGVGKTSLVNLFHPRLDNAPVFPTITAAFVSKSDKDKNLCYRINDISILSVAVPNVMQAHAVILVFALDNVQSFQYIPSLVQQMREKNSKAPVILVATKSDKLQTVPDTSIKRLEKYLGVSCIRTNHQDESSVHDIFTTAATLALKRQAKPNIWVRRAPEIILAGLVVAGATVLTIMTTGLLPVIATGLAFVGAVGTLAAISLLTIAVVAATAFILGAVVAAAMIEKIEYLQQRRTSKPAASNTNSKPMPQISSTLMLAKAGNWLHSLYSFRPEFRIVKRDDVSQAKKEVKAPVAEVLPDGAIKLKNGRVDKSLSRLLGP
jgi:GTPase SAR1 family protein